MQPHADAFLTSVDEANAWVGDRKVRRYQRDILASDRLTLVSPFTGAPAAALGCCWVARGQYLAYRFDFGPAAWIVANEARMGFPLTTLLLDGQAPQGIVQWEGRRLGADGAGPMTFAMLEALWLESRGDRAASPPAILTGHPNFAHHLWNELSGLLDHLRTPPAMAGDPVEVLALYEPFGRLADLLAGAPATVAATFPSDPGLNRRSGLLTRIGSTIVSDAAKAEVLAVCGAARDGLARRFKPTFWISVRLDIRTCVNQTDYLAAVMARLLRDFPECKVCFDGFSFPEDMGLDTRYRFMSDAHRARAEACASAIAHIIEAARPTPAERERLTIVSGEGLAAAIFAARAVDYYICHAGTLQHKIGWLYDTPGYIHACTPNLSPAALKWYVAQVENPAPLDAIPIGLIDDIPEPPPTPNRNWRYRINDVEAAVAHVLGCVHAAIG